MMKHLLITLLIVEIICIGLLTSFVACLAGNAPEHEPDPALADDNHLTQLLQDLQQPGMVCVYDKQAGHWVAVEVE